MAQRRRRWFGVLPREIASRLRSRNQDESVVQEGPETVKNRVPYGEHVDWHLLYPTEIILNGPARKEIALTFDDGPDGKWTPEVLNILRASDVQATFMCVGENVSANPDILKQVFDDGHLIGNHSWSHPNMTKQTLTEIRNEIQRTDHTIFRIVGAHPYYFRPPYGALNEEIIRELIQLHYKILFWDVDSLDWAGLTAEQVEANVLGHAKAGSIILMHSAGGRGGCLEDTIQALPVIISTLRKQGYRFKTVADLLRLPAYRK